MHQQDSLSKRVERFALLIATVFALTSAIIITQRLSNDALALLVGLVAGIMVMLPPLAFGFVLWRWETTRQQNQSRRTFASTQPQTPVVVVTPSMLTGPTTPQTTGNESVSASVMPWNTAPSERVFTIVGGEE